MSTNFTYTKLFCILILFTTVETLLHHTRLNFLPTAFWWGLNSLIFILFFKIKPIYYNKDEESQLIINLYLLWNIISILRGLFIADNYWELKNLIGITFSLLIPLLIHIFSNKDFLQKLLSFWFKYMLIVLVFILPFFIDGTGFFGRYLTLFMLLFLFFPLLPRKWKIITLISFGVVLLAGLDARSNVLRFIMAAALGFIYYFRFFLIEKLFKILHSILIALPIVLLFLGLTGIFNIFDTSEYIKNQKNDLTVDTRTFLYVENINSAIDNDYILEGRTPARGYDSAYFGDFLKWELKTGKLERFSSEVGILNIFTWNGLIGVILYFLIFFRSSYLAIYKSNNYFIKIIGLFVAFRWTFSFIEELTSFSLQYISLWIIISMSFSKEFREMDNDKFEQWVLGIFDKNKRRIT